MSADKDYISCHFLMTEREIIPTHITIYEKQGDAAIDKIFDGKSGLQQVDERLVKDTKKTENGSTNS